MPEMKLLPCPFCGGAALVKWSCGCITDGEPCGEKGGDIVGTVFCSLCNVEVLSVEHWQKRVSTGVYMAELADMTVDDAIALMHHRSGEETVDQCFEAASVLAAEVMRMRAIS